MDENGLGTGAMGSINRSSSSVSTSINPFGISANILSSCKKIHSPLS